MRIFFIFLVLSNDIFVKIMNLIIWYIKKINYFNLGKNAATNPKSGIKAQKS